MRMSENGRGRVQADKPVSGERSPRALHVCMHVRGTARLDARVMREAKALADAGFSVTVVDIERDASRGREETIDGVQLRHLVLPSHFTPSRFKPWFLVRLMRSWLRAALTLADVPADAFHAHDVDALPPCSVVARAKRRPLILDAHELPLVQPHLTRWRRLRALAVRVLRILVARCTAVILTAQPMVDEMQHLYGGPRATIVRNFPPYAPPVSSNRLRETLNLPPKTKIALYQGNLQANRTLHILVEAARYLAPDIVIVMMGKGPLRERLHTMIEEQGVQDRVKMLPAVPYAELLEWTASADLGLTVFEPHYSPHIYLCLPNKLFEYLMVGLPVLTSRMVAVADIVTTYGVGRVVETLDPQVVGEAISDLLANRTELERMRHQALEAARQDLNWEHEQQYLLDLYRTLLAPRLRTSSPAVSTAQSVAEGR